MDKKVKILLSGEGLKEERIIEINAGAADQEIIETFHRETSPEGSVEEYRLFFEKIEGDEVEIIEEDVRIIREQTRVHCHRCAEVAVTVGYQEETKIITVEPDETIGKLVKKAAASFEIKPIDAASLVLKLDGKDLQVNAIIGNFVQAPHCKIALELAPSPKFQG